MSRFSIDTAAYDALDAARQLDRFSVDLPGEARRWLDRLTELRANPPAEAPRNQVAELIVDAAKPAEVDRALARAVSQHLRIGQQRLAQQIAGQRMLDALLADGDRVHAELAATANPIIERLHHAALLDETVAELARARRVDDAHALATASADVDELNDLFTIRNSYLTAPGSQWSTGWHSCAIWSNPWAIGHVAENGGSTWDRWRAVIRAGGRLGYLSHAEAVAASQAHEPSGMTAPIDPRRSTFAG